MTTEQTSTGNNSFQAMEDRSQASGELTFNDKVIQKNCRYRDGTNRWFIECSRGVLFISR